MVSWRFGATKCRWWRFVCRWTHLVEVTGGSFGGGTQMVGQKQVVTVGACKIQIIVQEQLVQQVQVEYAKGGGGRQVEDNDGALVQVLVEVVEDIRCPGRWIKLPMQLQEQQTQVVVEVQLDQIHQYFQQEQWWFRNSYRKRIKQSKWCVVNAKSI